MDFNNREQLSKQLTEKIDTALQAKQQADKSRDYLGASRLGIKCDRALQFEYLNIPVDEDKYFSGQTLRVFQAGHVFEQLAVEWMGAIGFNLKTHTSEGKQFGFSRVNGRIQGHIDGAILSGPQDIKISYPALWECKAVKDRTWRDIKKRGLTISQPVYAAQIALYQAYMEEQFPGISNHPAMLTVINKNTAEIYFELIPFNGQLAQRISDRAVNILRACDANEWLPRVANNSTFFICKTCPWQQQCWSN